MGSAGWWRLTVSWHCIAVLPEPVQPFQNANSAASYSRNNYSISCSRKRVQCICLNNLNHWSCPHCSIRSLLFLCILFSLTDNSHNSCVALSLWPLMHHPRHFLPRGCSYRTVCTVVAVTLLCVCIEFVFVCVFTKVCVCVGGVDGRGCMRVFVWGILAVAVNGASAFAWFAARHTVHSCTVIFCAVKCCFWLLFVKTVAVKIVK